MSREIDNGGEEARCTLAELVRDPLVGIRIQPVTTGKDAAMSNWKRVLSTGIIAALLTAAPVGNFTDAGNRLGGPLAVDLAYNTFPPEHLNNAYGQIHILGEDQGLPNEALSSFGVNWLQGFAAQGEVPALRVLLHLAHILEWFRQNGGTAAQIDLWFKVIKRVVLSPYQPDHDVGIKVGHDPAIRSEHNLNVPSSPPPIERYASIRRLYSEMVTQRGQLVWPVPREVLDTHIK
jgi:hypothetical protein